MAEAAAASQSQELLSAADMALLRRLDLVHRRGVRGLLPGQRKSRKSSRSPEFADVRPYAPGDDIRQIDWRAYARLDRLMLRTYVAEEEAAVNVVVDASASMGIGDPPKWEAARRLAAGLAMVGLGAADRVAVGTMGGGDRFTPHLRLGNGAGAILGFLTGVEVSGVAGPAELGRLRWLRPGLTIVVSDFMVEGSWEPALLALGKAGQDMILWQVLAPEEERPRLSGDLRLVDVESGQTRDLTVTPRLVAEYTTALAAHRDELQRQAGSAGGRFLHTTSDEELQAGLQAALRTGVLKRS